MRYEPHDYQVYAAEYIKQHDVAAVRALDGVSSLDPADMMV